MNKLKNFFRPNNYKGALITTGIIVAFTAIVYQILETKNNIGNIEIQNRRKNIAKVVKNTLNLIERTFNNK